MCEQLLEDENTPLNDPERYIDNALGYITYCIKEAEANLPHKTFDKKLKPYWIKSLTHLSREKRRIWREWNDAGRPRGQADIFK